MATRKGDDDVRGAERIARGDDERPGVYVQVVGAPRRRKGSGAKFTNDEPSSNSVERVGASAGRYQAERNAEESSSVERVGVPAGRYQVERTVDEPSEDTRPMERTFASPRRARGPLGMDEAAPVVEERSEVQERPEAKADLKKTSLGLGPRLDPELMIETRAREAVHVDRTRDRTNTPPQRFEASPPPSTRVESAPPIEFEPPPSVGHMRVVEVVSPEPPPSENTNYRADIVRASAAPLVVHREEAEQLPSLLGARASIRPSDPVRRSEGPSWSMVVGVAVLSSIIASAGVVALQELFRGGPRELQTATSLASSSGEVERVAPAPAPVVLPAPAAVAPVTAPALAVVEPVAAGGAPAPVPATAVVEPSAGAVGATPPPAAPAPAQAAVVDPPAVAPAPAARPVRAVARPVAGRPAIVRAPLRAPAAKPVQAPAAPASDDLAPSTRSPGGGNRILNDGLVSPDRSPAPEPEAGEPLPGNPYE